MDETTEKGGPDLRRAREARRMTQAHLAQAAGVSARTVMRAENGEDVSAESMRAICSVLGLDAEAVDAPSPAEERKRKWSPVEATFALILDRILDLFTGRGTQRRELRLTLTSMAFVMLLASAFLATKAIQGLILPQSYVRYVGWSDSVGMRKAVALAAPLSRGMDALAGDFDTATTFADDDWSVAVDNRPGWLDMDCDDPDFWSFLRSSERTCRPWEGGVKVTQVGQDRMTARVGPFPGKPLAMTARLLTPNPKVRVSVAFTETPEAPASGVLWLDPRGLADGQVPQHPGRKVYMHVVASLKEGGR